MAGIAKAPEERKSKLVIIRLTPKQYESVVRAADSAERSLTDWARLQILKAASKKSP